MGRWSDVLAEPFLDFSGVGDGKRILDVGCGVGGLALALVRRASISDYIGLDCQPEAVSAATSRAGEHPKVRFVEGDAYALPFSAQSFDTCLALLVLNFLSDPARAVGEMVRVVRPGGLLAAAVWDFSGGLPTHRMFYDTAAAIDPGAEKLRQGFARPLQRRGELAALWRRFALEGVEEKPVTVWMEFTNFADYWKGWSWACREYLASLNDDVRNRLVDRTEAAYRAGRGDGPRAFTATAWVVRGILHRPPNAAEVSIGALGS